MILSRSFTTGATALVLLALSGCERKPAPPEPRETTPAAGHPVAVASPPASPTDPPPIPTDLRTARLSSRDCATVALFYSDALFTSQYQQAARAWDKDNGVDGAMLARRFDNMEGLKLDIGEVAEEGAAGSLYCTVQVTLRHDNTAARHPVAAPGQRRAGRHNRAVALADRAEHPRRERETCELSHYRLNKRHMLG